MIHKSFVLTPLSILIFLLPQIQFHAQNNYQKAWEALNQKKVAEAVQHFEKALEEKENRTDAILSLALLYPSFNREKEAAPLLEAYFKNTSDPYPALYPLWFEESFLGDAGKKEPHQLGLLETMAEDNRDNGLFDPIVNYWLGTHYVFSFDAKRAQTHYDKIGEIDRWQLLGPFDNVMNSGFDKDFGVLANPQKGAGFQSKYGAEITWFEPDQYSDDGYFFKSAHFFSNNSIIYAQAFVKSDSDREAILNFGYSGSLKLWLNDALVYSEPEHRVTEMGYFKFKCRLNKGYNRILVQLGEHEESNPNFTIRITDTGQKPLSLETRTNHQKYEKNKMPFSRIPFTPLEKLKERVSQNPEDLLSKILLAKAYFRSNELNEAEHILKEAYRLAPENYLVLRNLNILYNQSGNTTEQNRYYDIFKDLFPNDKDILENEIEEYNSQDDRVKLKAKIAEYQRRYPSDYTRLYYNILLANSDEAYDKAIALIDTMYQKFPNDYLALTSKYRIEKTLYSNPEKSNKILEIYLKNNYNYTILEELVKNYREEGRIEEAIKIFEKAIDLVDYDTESYRKIINLLYRQKKYREAIEVCNKIISRRPSDYSTFNDLAVLHKLIGEEKKALGYYEESLQYFPFSFEVNEKIRELKNLPSPTQYIPETEPAEIIKEYEAAYSTEVKKPYDIVYEQNALIIFKSMSQGNIHRYILKLNDESAIEGWQRLNLGASENMTITVNEAKTIKKNGNKINAERYGAEVVFTNLEPGDYIYVAYTEKQVNGGKSSLFISDTYTFDSYFPVYKLEYHLVVEDGVKFQTTFLNGSIDVQVKTLEGFKQHSWTAIRPPVLEEEAYAIPLSDVAKSLHISLDYTWKDIAQWYSDLSGHQAKADYTIKQLVKEMFGEKDYSNYEKARMIYDFVCKNIQYSWIDFRQSGYIPQKASDVYHSRLGDCKDVSTLYASLAREAGLDAQLVLINTRNNGQKNVYLPSLNFNHCIVKVNIEQKPTYLELTDPDLPFGHLYYYHQGAAILEIPNKPPSENIQLNYLALNEGFPNVVERKSKITVDEDLQMRIEVNSVKTGTNASSMCKSYYNQDHKQQKEDIQRSISNSFNSIVKLESLNFEQLAPLKDSAVYSYDFVVTDEIMKVGSFKSIKIPFSDLIATKDIFEGNDRNFEFDYIYYENTDQYSEEILVSIAPEFVIAEIPENVHLEYNGNIYDLKLEQINDQEVKINRTFTPRRENVKPEDFEAFKTFFTKVLETENSYLIFK